jgi:hypothetical protein
MCHDGIQVSCILAILETKGILVVRNITLSFGCISSTWISKPFVSFFCAEVVVCMGDKRNACRVLEGRAERERPLQTCRQVWYVNIKMYLKEIGWGAGAGLI